VTGSVARVRDTAGVSTPAAAAIVFVLVAFTVAGVSVATRLGFLPVAVLLAGMLALIPVSIRWPLLPLFIFVAVVPVEDALNLTGIGTVSRLAGVYFAVAYAVPRLGQLTLRAMPVAGWAFVVWACLSILWAIDPGVAQNQLLTLLQLFVIGLLVADVVVHEPTIVRPVLWVYTMSATVTAGLGIVAFLGGNSVAGARVAALPGQDPAQFAAILLPAFVFSINEFLRGRRPVASAVAASLCAIAIVVSGTRGAWVGAAVAFALFVLPRLHGRQRIAAVVAAGALFLVVAQIPGLLDLFVARAELAASTGGAGRTDIWAVGLQIAETYPITGVGHANFPVAFHPAFVPDTPMYEVLGLGRAPHSILVGTFAELGIIGLGLLVLFLGPLLLRRGWGEDAAAVQAMLAAILVSALFLDVIANRKQVWLVIGLAAGLAYLRKRQATSAAAHVDRPGPDAGARPP
jgi:O-antigen ligase